MKEKVSKLKQLSFLNKDCIYSDFLDRFSSNLGEIDNNPFIGYVGKNYFKAHQKICFVGKAGAEAKGECSIARDKFMDKKLIQFRNASDEKSITAFFEYQKVVREHIQDWEVYKKIPAYLNSKISQDIDDIAYVNIVPFRYKREPIKSVYCIAFKAFTNKFFDIIEPSYIVPLGKYLADEIRQKYSGSAKIENGIRRTNGDKYLHPDAEKQMNELAIKINSLA